MPLVLDEASLRAKQEAEMKKLFRLKVSLEILGNEELHKLSEGKVDGAATAHALIRRANEVALKYLNEDD